MVYGWVCEYDIGKTSIIFRVCHIHSVCGGWDRSCAWCLWCAFRWAKSWVEWIPIVHIYTKTASNAPNRRIRIIVSFCFTPSFQFSSWLGNYLLYCTDSILWENELLLVWICVYVSWSFIAILYLQLSEPPKYSVLHWYLCLQCHRINRGFDCDDGIEVETISWRILLFCNRISYFGAICWFGVCTNNHEYLCQRDDWTKEELQMVCRVFMV